jgi:hypothetical protein
MARFADPLDGRGPPCQTNQRNVLIRVVSARLDETVSTAAPIVRARLKTPTSAACAAMPDVDPLRNRRGLKPHLVDSIQVPALTNLFLQFGLPLHLLDAI